MEDKILAKGVVFIIPLKKTTGQTSFLKHWDFSKVPVKVIPFIIWTVFPFISEPIVAKLSAKQMVEICFV